LGSAGAAGVSGVAWHNAAAPMKSRAAPPRARRARPLAVDAGGCVRGARLVASPNCDERPQDTPITLVVVHGISLPPGEFGGDAIERLFTNRLDPHAHPCFAEVAGVRVSAHFLIRRDGEVVQFVPCGRRAWHAGESAWRGRSRCNDFSVGIELEGTDAEPYADAQYAALARLCKALLRRYPIAEFVGHSDVAPGRKTDPGPAFEWARLARALRRPLRQREKQGPTRNDPASGRSGV
jgi:N-acetyl-anhydromuramoyl-L-alanine amidase